MLDVDVEMSVVAGGEDVDVWGGSVDVDAGGGELGVEPGGGGAPAVTVHDLTTWTRDSPFPPVTGVNVMVHVSVTGPASLQSRARSEGFAEDGHATHVWVVCTVCMENGCVGGFPFP